MTYVVRAQGSPTDLIASLKSAVTEVSPAAAVQFRSFSGQLQESLLRERLMATLSGGFGLLAGLLATLGLYGVIAYMVARRRNEIGVRMALGADRGRVIRLVLSESMVLLGVGVAAGLVISIWAARAASSLLFEVKPYDPVSVAGAVMLLEGVALLASYAPARRAAALEPMNALRDE
jgi:putative ABC transport system permease protein